MYLEFVVFVTMPLTRFVRGAPIGCTHPACAQVPHEIIDIDGVVSIPTSCQVLARFLVATPLISSFSCPPRQSFLSPSLPVKSASIRLSREAKSCVCIRQRQGLVMIGLQNGRADIGRLRSCEARGMHDLDSDVYRPRRRMLVSVFGIPILLRHAGSAFARNLPESTGASAALRGTTEGLVPVVRLSNAVSSAIASLPDLKLASQSLASVPASEKEFKRVFDEYSQGISYKQQYLDKNAFLVYYTKGFDGVGRPSIETESAEESKQKEQYGLRNEAWLAVDDARAELAFLSKNPPKDEGDLTELRGAFSRAQIAFSSYFALAPAEQFSAAKAAAPQ